MSPQPTEDSSTTMKYSQSKNLQLWSCSATFISEAPISTRDIMITISLQIQRVTSWVTLESGLIRLKVTKIRAVVMGKFQSPNSTKPVAANMKGIMVRYQTKALKLSKQQTLLSAMRKFCAKIRIKSEHSTMPIVSRYSSLWQLRTIPIVTQIKLRNKLVRSMISPRPVVLTYFLSLISKARMPVQECLSRWSMISSQRLESFKLKIVFLPSQIIYNSFMTEPPIKKHSRRKNSQLQKTHQCPHCQRKYGSVSALQNHVRLKHPGNPVPKPKVVQTAKRGRPRARAQQALQQSVPENEVLSLLRNQNFTNFIYELGEFGEFQPKSNCIIRDVWETPPAPPSLPFPGKFLSLLFSCLRKDVVDWMSGLLLLAEKTWRSRDWKAAEQEIALLDCPDQLKKHKQKEKGSLKQVIQSLWTLLSDLKGLH